jgi:hypothetical protein
VSLLLLLLLLLLLEEEVVGTMATAPTRRETASRKRRTWIGDLRGEMVRMRLQLRRVWGNMLACGRVAGG